VTHHASPAFWKAYEALAPGVREIADRSFALLKDDPQHPSLRLKKVGIYWSARVDKRHRALAMEVEDGLLWFWIGTHDDYGRLIKG
jgi:hypothetical protein